MLPTAAWPQLAKPDCCPENLQWFINKERRNAFLFVSAEPYDFHILFPCHYHKKLILYNYEQGYNFPLEQPSWKVGAIAKIAQTSSFMRLTGNL
jgi:hypothetical protein